MRVHIHIALAEMICKNGGVRVTTDGGPYASCGNGESLLSDDISGPVLRSAPVRRNRVYRKDFRYFLRDGSEKMLTVMLAIASYLYGSIPFGYVAARIMKGVKLTEKGTGNVGVTNAFKAGGTGVGIITVMGEISKGLVPVYAAGALVPGSRTIALLLVFCTLVGTSFSLFLKGRGGKGSTAAIWSILLLSPYACLLLLATWSILALLARITIRIKQLQLLCIPCVIHLVERDPVFTIFGIVASILFWCNSYRRKDDFAYYNILKQKSGLSGADTLQS